ncbi:MAG: hypothetical protein KJ579_01380 [Verrucomicrobia bacterium]|nr:hypothetical protein [Verrucomicrobiota bacterium]
MNPNADAATVQQALQVFYVIGGVMALLGVVKAVLDIAAFFRRQPPIEQTIAAISKQFNDALNERVHIRDFQACDARHGQQIRDAEFRHTAAIAEAEARHAAAIEAMESRIDKRIEGLHGSLVELRRTSIQATLDVMKDLGYVAGAKADKDDGRRAGG